MVSKVRTPRKIQRKARTFGSRAMHTSPLEMRASLLESIWVVPVQQRRTKIAEKKSCLDRSMLSRSSSAYQPLGGNCTAQVDEDDSKVGTEMTSIAIISQHPFRNSNSHAPMISTVSGGPAPELDDYSICNTSDGEEKESGSWTNFHFVMCVGIVGFFVFWIILLCRMYLPPEFQFWGPGPKPKV